MTTGSTISFPIIFDPPYQLDDVTCVIEHPLNKDIPLSAAFFSDGFSHNLPPFDEVMLKLPFLREFSATYGHNGPRWVKDPLRIAFAPLGITAVWKPLRNFSPEVGAVIGLKSGRNGNHWTKKFAVKESLDQVVEVFPHLCKLNADIRVDSVDHEWMEIALPVNGIHGIERPLDPTDQGCVVFQRDHQQNLRDDRWKIRESFSTVSRLMLEIEEKCQRLNANPLSPPFQFTQA